MGSMWEYVYGGKNRKMAKKWVMSNIMCHNSEKSCIFAKKRKE